MSPASAFRRHGLLVACVIGSTMIAAVLVAMTLGYGETLTAPETEEAQVPVSTFKAGHGKILFHVLLALAAIILLGRILAWIFSWIHQPPVIGEIVAGILLGPSLLGLLAPEAREYLLPVDAAPRLGTVAQLGAILYMFLIGLELDTGHLLKLARSVVTIAIVGLLVPFVGGMVLALWLYPSVSTRDVPFTSFALFVGIAVGITAFPVMARILKDRGLEGTSVGVTALGAAAVADVLAWCLLALVVGVAKNNIVDALHVALWAGAYVAAMFLVVRPILNVWWEQARDRTASAGIMTLVLLGALVSALATQAIGIHAVLGAFLFGVLIPHDSPLAQDIRRKLMDLVTVLLLPAFFAITGLRTQIGLLNSGAEWLMCAAIVFAAIVTKFGGTFIAARLTGHDWRNASAVGTLMITHGLMELIVLNIGLDLGVISPTLFAMMVIMALVTTMTASPVLHYLLPRPSLLANERKETIDEREQIAT